MEKEKKIHFITLGQIDSTNEWAKRNASSFSPEDLTCILATSQTAGKGRWAKNWQSCEGDLFASFCLFTKRKDLIPHYGQVLAVATIKVLKQHFVDAQMKWPNDLYAEEKKLGGILTESISFKENPFMIIGIGLNVNMEEKEASLIDQPATSLFLVTKKKSEVHELFVNIAHAFHQELLLLEEKGFGFFVDFCNDHLYAKGKQVTFTLKEKTHQGLCLCITAEGKLQVQLSSGEIMEISSGEVNCLRNLNQGSQ